MIYYWHFCLFLTETHCPDGFEYSNIYERCFRRYYTPLVTWFEANQTCNSHNQNVWSKFIPHHVFDIASVRNHDENEFLRSLLDDKDPTEWSPHSQPWVGLYQKVSTSWVSPRWSDWSVVRYQNWAPNEPTDYQV